MNIFEIEQLLSSVVGVVLLVIAIFALVNCLLYSAASYEAAGKLGKPAWSLILALAVLLEAVPYIGASFPFGILQIAAVVAPLVYLADVRPAVAGLRRR